ncbi:MAG: HIT family protein [Candidatus Saccharicenans sp.]|nr:MAG: HIT family hydrolase [Candidatus Aminicenantes bacterium]HEK85980.1 HIT domain-containing protein [Candidatus Aminicenantes bacterium]
MKYLAAPWRQTYVQKALKMKGCIFCEAWKKKNLEEALILFRGKHNFILLNRYPYTTGHLMIAPYRHIKNFDRAPKEIVMEGIELAQLALRILKRIYHPHGFNLGLNLGHSAGAGVAGHYHLHLVPRWTGDANFMPIISETKIFCEDLLTTYNRLRPYFLREEQKQEK